MIQICIPDFHFKNCPSRSFLLKIDTQISLLVVITNDCDAIFVPDYFFCNLQYQNLYLQIISLLLCVLQTVVLAHFLEIFNKDHLFCKLLSRIIFLSNLWYNISIFANCRYGSFVLQIAVLAPFFWGGGLPEIKKSKDLTIKKLAKIQYN